MGGQKSGDRVRLQPLWCYLSVCHNWKQAGHDMGNSRTQGREARGAEVELGHQTEAGGAEQLSPNLGAQGGHLLRTGWLWRKWAHTHTHTPICH